MTYISDSLEIYQFMEEKNVLLAYTGQFDHFVTSSLLKNVKKKFNLSATNPAIAKKIYNLLVESIENISKHSLKEEGNENTSLLLLCKSETTYTIITGNHILKSDIPELKGKLEKIAIQDQEELKNSYRKQILLQNKNDNNAGLGLIDIAIRSGNKIKFDFKPVTSSASFCLLQIETNV